MALGIVQQLKDLAAVPENRHYIVNEHGCLPGLVTFVAHEEEEVRRTALEALEMLAAEPRNVKAMKEEPGMAKALEQIAESEHAGEKEKAHVILSSIKNFEEDGLELAVSTTTLASAENEEKENSSGGVDYEETVITTTTTTTKRKVKAKRGANIDADIRPLRARQTRDGTGRVRKVKRKARTYTIYIMGLAIESDREQVERALLARKGIISFLIDLTEQKVVVRAVISGEAVIDTIATSGYEASFDKPEKATAIIDFLEDDGDEEDESMSIVEHGACDQAPQEEGWLGWGSRIGRALWG